MFHAFLSRDYQKAALMDGVIMIHISEIVTSPAPHYLDCTSPQAAQPQRAPVGPSGAPSQAPRQQNIPNLKEHLGDISDTVLKTFITREHPEAAQHLAHQCPTVKRCAPQEAQDRFYAEQFHRQRGISIMPAGHKPRRPLQKRE
eukprot:jgi/Ulvmu1/12914/UM099_0004.1